MRGLLLAWCLSSSVAVGQAGAAQDQLTHRGKDFSLQYPEKDAKLQPASANVPFQLVYRKNSLMRLETERLTQPIDLSDATFASIFMEVQLEKLRERVQAPLEVQRVRQFSWGPGVEFSYFLPSRDGKKNRRDLVTEVVTTRAETLYRFTYWIPERDLAKVASQMHGIVESFSPDAPVTATASPSAPASSGDWESRPYSLWGAEQAIRRYREEVAGAGATDGDVHARLAEALGWKAYLTGGGSRPEADELDRSAESALKLAPDDVDSQQARAWAAYHANRMVEMESAIKRALEIEPTNAENHLLYALWYGFNPERSREMAARALEQDPEYVAALYVKALAEHRLGNLDGAREALEKAVALDPRFATADLELAEVLQESGDTEASLRAYLAAVTASPDDVNTRFRFAVALRRAGRIDEAVREYQEALKLDPTLAEIHYNLAVLYLNELQRNDLGAISFQRFLELDPESDRADQVRAWLKENGY